MTTLSYDQPSSSSSIAVPGLQIPESAGWEEIESAFSEAPALPFAQHWRSELEPRFRAGTVRLGWQGDRFLVFADLNDDHVTTRAIRRNEMLYTLGDVFEIFTGVKGNAAYIEYHFSPNDLILQLAFPAADSIRSGAGIETFLKIENESAYKVRNVPGGWQIFAVISKNCLPGADGSLRGQEWDVNFGRYDYGEEGTPPVLSSTSPLTVAGFHRRDEWRSIRFE